MAKKSSKQKKSKPVKTAKKKQKSSVKRSSTKRQSVKPKRASPKSRATSVKAKKGSGSGKSGNGIVVRIMGQGQYRLDSGMAGKLNEIDNEIVKIIQAAPHEGSGQDGLYKRFKKMLGEMTELVTRKGREVAPSEIIPSDLILPPEDISIEGARELFQGEGLIPG